MMVPIMRHDVVIVNRITTARYVLIAWVVRRVSVDGIRGEEKYISTAVNNIAATVERSNTTIAANLGTDAQNREAVSQLTARGYTSGYYGGQVYAARDNQSYFNGLPTQARNDLARWLVG